MGRRGLKGYPRYWSQGLLQKRDLLTLLASFKSFNSSPGFYFKYCQLLPSNLNPQRYCQIFSGGGQIMLTFQTLVLYSPFKPTECVARNPLAPMLTTVRCSRVECSLIGHKLNSELQMSSHKPNTRRKRKLSYTQSMCTALEFVFSDF